MVIHSWGLLLYVALLELNLESAYFEILNLLLLTCRAELCWGVIILM